MGKKENKKKPEPSSLKKKKFPLFYKITAGALLLAVVLFFVLNIFEKESVTEEEEYVFKKEGELLFIDSLGNTKAKIDIEISDTDFDRQLGLMFRKSMHENQGMLFIFPVETIQSFWMRNTNISLDILFINEEQKIVTIHKNTRTLSDQSYPSSAPARYVVEVIAGFTDKYNIMTGDKVTWLGTRLSF